MLDAVPPVLLGDEQLELSRLRVLLLCVGDGGHAGDGGASPGDEPGAQGVDGVVPAREHLRGLGSDVRQPHGLIAHEPVESSEGVELRGVVGVQRGGDDERRDRRCVGDHVSSFFQAPS